VPVAPKECIALASLKDEDLRPVVEARPTLESLGLEPELMRCDRWIGACLLRRAGPGDREEARRVLEAAGEAAARMRLSEAGAISELLCSG
jgi:hypothetical protein